MDNVS